MSTRSNAKRRNRPKGNRRSASEPKRRLTTVWVDFGKDQVLSGMSPPNERGELVFYGEDGKPVAPKHISVGTTYERTKGRKTVTRAQANPSSILLSVNSHLEHYDWVFAVDTNTGAIGSENVSITAVVLLRDIVVKDQTWSAKVIPQTSLEFRDARVPAERLGWRHVMWLIDQSKLQGKIAMFVDSALDELAPLNNRDQALLEGFQVPNNVTLLYASSDVGAAELIGNKALRECDRYSRALMARIEADDQGTGELQSNLPGFCKAYRFWDPPK